MDKVIKLPDNLIGIDDHKNLESFGAHQISRGRLTRYHWNKDNNDDPVFELYRGGANEVLVTTIERDRAKGEFQAKDGEGKMLMTGTLDHIMAFLDRKLSIEHGETIVTE